jgi:hypothetical protein
MQFGGGAATSQRKKSLKKLKLPTKRLCMKTHLCFNLSEVEQLA